MPITDKQRKMIWTGAIIFCLYYFVPALVSAGRNAFTAKQPAITKPSPAHVAVSPPLDAAAKQAAATAAQFDKLAGDWSGEASLPLGMCRLALQLRSVPEKPANYSGYSTMTCNPTLLLLSQRMPKEQRDIEITKSMTPTSTVMSGTVEHNEIVFHTDKAIGMPASGCAIRGFTVSPFGGEQIAAEWQTGTCQGGGQMVLNRVTNLR